MSKKLILLCLISMLFTCKQASEKIKPANDNRHSVEMLSKYKKEINSRHYVIIKSTEENLNSDRKNFKEHNIKNNFSNINVNILKLAENKQQPIVSIGKFKNSEKAKEYIQLLIENNTINKNVEIFPISMNNYRTLLSTSDLEGYVSFLNNL